MKELRIEDMIDEVSAANLRATVEKLAAFGTRSTCSDTKSDARGIGAAQRWLKARLEECAGGGRMQVSLDAFETVIAGRRVEAANVVATLPGTRKESAVRTCVVGAHYDSRNGDRNDGTRDAPGAVDDASGVAVVLEIARILARKELPATVVFALFTGEEQGLLGSRHWAAAAKQKGMSIDAMLNNDIVGNAVGANGEKNAGAVRVFAEEGAGKDLPEDDSPSRQLARYAKEMASVYLPGFEVRRVCRKDRLGRGGDHLPFSGAGWPAIRFVETFEDYSRQHADVKERDGKPYGDLPAWFDEGYCAKVAKVNLATLASLALAPAPPQEVVLRGARTHVTRLSWKAGSEADKARYEVLSRATTSPEWEKVAPVGDVTEHTLPNVYPDDLLFAVRAVDAQGHQSRAVFAVPRVE